MCENFTKFNALKCVLEGEGGVRGFGYILKNHEKQIFLSQFFPWRKSCVKGPLYDLLWNRIIMNADKECERMKVEDMRTTAISVLESVGVEQLNKMNWFTELVHSCTRYHGRNHGLL